MNDFYIIQSSIDSKFGATIYPENIYKGGAGWFLHYVGSGKALSQKELRDIAGDVITDELVAEARILLATTDHYGEG